MTWRHLLPRSLCAAAGASFVLFSATAANSSPASSTHALSYNDGHHGRTPRMIIRDPDAFAHKMKKFVEDGPEQLLVIADFDRTLTPYYKPQSDPQKPLEQENSSHGLLMTSSALPPEVATAHQKLFARYYPVETSSNLSAEEKFPFLAKWWESVHSLLVEYQLSKDQVKTAVASGSLSFRPGFHSLFRLLHDQQVPTLVFSAGLYDVIHAALEKEFAAEHNCTHITAEEIPDEQKFTPDNVHVVSNMMHFDAKGRIERFDGPVIHPLTKTAHALLDSPYWKECQLDKRRNVLLLGDSRGDVRMADGLDADEIIRIGFLNLKVDEALEEYLELYDVVFTDDASLVPVQMLIEQITAVSTRKE
ncbi:Pyrimidine 5'-nucleotidase (UMPH-1) [Phytophthora infestans]|uniref:5'-nucleotidase n=2 Tax=Phytophthora infestans TaxID=4787 RepID=A0A8S9V683_PHYIN|nr:Pyrimidine 5'-nucleotidase (UMPH-1) [Phytophthora infestans]